MESECIFFGQFNSDFSQRGIEREDSSGSSVAYLIQVGTAQKFS